MPVRDQLVGFSNIADVRDGSASVKSSVEALKVGSFT